MKKQVLQKYLTISFGIVIAMAVVLSQAFYFQFKDFHKEKAKSEQSEKSDQKTESAAYFSVPDSSIPSTFSVELNQELSVVLEILFKTDHQAEVYHAPAISTGQIFHTLFSVLISPNAP